MALILDTGPIYASLDRRDAAHDASRRLLLDSVEQLVIPAPVLVEVDQLVARRLGLGAFGSLMSDILRGAYYVEALDGSDYARVQRICDQYRDSNVGFVDAAVLAVVERLNEPKLATLDHRHFRLLRPRHI